MLKTLSCFMLQKSYSLFILKNKVGGKRAQWAKMLEQS